MAPICCPIRELAILSPELEAVVSPNRRLSYRTLDQLVTKAMAALARRELMTGQRVAIWAPNSVEYIILIFALLRLRAVVCPLSSRYPPDAVNNILRNIHCEILLTQSDRHQELVGNLTPVKFHELIDFEQEIFPKKTVIRSIPISMEQDATILFTTGSTGSAKAVLHTYGNHWFSAKGANKNIHVGNGDRWLFSLPVWHVGGLAILFRCFIGGGTVVVPSNHDSAMQFLNEIQITHISVVPTQLRRLMLDKRLCKRLSYCKAILLGGDSISTDLLGEAISLKLRVYTTYGSTELASQVTAAPSGISASRVANAGKLLEFRKLRIGGDQEILLKGKTLFRGYIHNGKLERPFDRNGWFHTGDLGMMSKNGYLTITGRKDNMFISGGENIQPEEIEELLVSFEVVSQAVVVPVPNNEFGFRPVGFIKTVDDQNIDAGRFVECLEVKLPRFKIPTKFYRWPSSPFSYLPSNKINRQYFAMLAQRLQKRKNL